MRRVPVRLSIAAFLIGCGAAPVLASDACVSGKDELALQTRVLQTELMVAALTCDQTKRYNDFVVKHQKELMGAHERLRVYFRRTRGAKGADLLNDFITRLANDSSKRSLANRPAFCRETMALYDAVLAEGAASLQPIIAQTPVTEMHGFRSCSAPPMPRPKPAAIAEAPAPPARPATP